ncbi:MULTISPECIES: hypothetical protein [Helicobacter]|nr:MULTISPECIES: hypothetical protein [unclassified Helicobacter]TLD86216.1 hypothetical protein LS67_008540 [Helicobacter sp. MIT 03-1616]
MTLIITNANKQFAKAVKSMAKACDSKIKIIEQNETSLEKQPSDELLEAIREVRNGEVERYESFEDFKKAMLDEVSH